MTKILSKSQENDVFKMIAALELDNWDFDWATARLGPREELFETINPTEPYPKTPASPRLLTRILFLISAVPDPYILIQADIALTRFNVFVKPLTPPRKTEL